METNNEILPQARMKEIVTSELADVMEDGWRQGRIVSLLPAREW